MRKGNKIERTIKLNNLYAKEKPFLIWDVF